MPQLQALIFDVDGTVAETERDGHRLAFNRAFAAANLNWDWSIDLYGDLLDVAGGKERIQFYMEQYNPVFQVANPNSHDLKQWIAELHHAKNIHYKQLLSTGAISVRPGIKRLLQEAREQGVRLAIATTSALDNAIVLLEAAIDPDAQSWFEVLAAGDIVSAKKPAPDIYLYVLEAMALEAENCLVIEDSQQGLQSALQAGLKTVVTVNSYTCNQDFSGAALVLSHLGELDQPFEVIAGDAGDATYFNLALAKALL